MFYIIFHMIYYIPKSLFRKGNVGFESHISVLLQTLCSRLLQTIEKAEGPELCSFREKPPHVLFSWQRLVSVKEGVLSI